MIYHRIVVTNLDNLPLKRISFCFNSFLENSTSKSQIFSSYSNQVKANT